MSNLSLYNEIRIQMKEDDDLVKTSTFTAAKEAFKLAGLSVRTTNADEAGPNGRLPGLWDAYFKSGMTSMMAAGMVNPDTLYALYTDYESDADGAYSVVIGHEIGDTETVAPDNYAHVTIPESKYVVFTTKRGPVYEVVIEAWVEIWEYFKHSPEERAYTGDFELYDARHFDPANAEVHIYIAVK